MDLNNLLLFFILISFGIFFYKYFLLVLAKYNLKFLIDNEFSKPQAFHDRPISTCGGLGIFISFLILFLFMFLLKENIYYDYFSFCSLFFILGFSEDIKMNIRPKFRLILMIAFLIILVISNKFYIQNTGIEFLNRFLEIDIFSLFFVCLCFLFIINGSNLIDGYNGLLGIHSLIILINLFLINFFGENNDLALFILCGIVIIVVFTKNNFPKAKIFLGDGGSYFIGSFIAVSIIKTSIANPIVSPFYFCILLFYLFFEVFFSFIRKIIIEKKSPLFPDNKHLHMLVYSILLKKNNDKIKSNYQTSISINFIYFMLTLPTFFFMQNGVACKYYSLLLFIIYIFSYKKLTKKIYTM